MTDLGHPQPKTPVHCDNATAVDIANNTVKRQRSRAMEMHFFWIGDKVSQDMYHIAWHPGLENLAGYQSKHHIGSHHVAVRPWYLHTADSPRYLPRAVKPSTLKGCVGTLKDGYIQKVPLLRVPRIQSTSIHVACTTIHRNPIHTGYLPIARIPTWNDLIESLPGLGRCIERYIPPFSPVRLM